MDQDDLEDEVFTKTVLAHLDFLSTCSRQILEFWQKQYMIQTELVYALALVLSLIFCLAKKKGLISIFNGSLANSGEESCEQKAADAAIFAIKGRRQTMEDRFDMVQIPVPHLPTDPIVRLFLILDGHGGQYAAVYVKKHLIESLVAKIKVLKLLTQKSRVDKQAIVKTALKLSPGSVSKAFLDFVGMTLIEYKKINPDSELFKQDNNNGNHKNSSISNNLVLSSRIKPIEELPMGKPSKIAKSNHNNNAEEKIDAGNAHNDMLSPYSNVPKKSHSKSPRRQESTKECVTIREITDYLNAKGEIQYPELLSDEISKVDESLLKAAKKDKQIGGTTLLLSILDDSTLWVANVGDSRGVLRNIKGEVVPLSFDHKPSQLKEKKRIEEAGGYVSLNGCWRVQGVLATSRALGDYPLKDQKVVVCEPDILSFQLQKDPPDFAILATDGLWDTHSNEDAVSFVDKCLNNNSETVLSAAKSLTRDAYSKGSTDNVSVMVLNLKNML